MQFETMIGLEVHCQLVSRTKAFCFAERPQNKEENSSVGVVSAGFPGALPVLNAEVVRLAVRAGLALNCRINEKSLFARKNYFYPDMPKGYQISQFDKPICESGFIEILSSGAKQSKRIEIERVHIEEDAGKLIHGKDSTLIDLNRSGVPLIEIVSRPDMRSPAEAAAYLRKLHAILVFAGVTDGNMEEGNFRCDANVSVRPVGSTQYGTRCEIKNLNSFKFIEKAISYEVVRQIATIEAGGVIKQETRGWDAATAKTFLMRSKEDVDDYRYFPDPDLPPLVLEPGFVEAIKAQMPELPNAKKARFQNEFQLSDYDAEVLTSTRSYADYFEQCVKSGAPAKLAANWILSELLHELNSNDIEISQSPVTPLRLTELLKLIESGDISGKIAKVVFVDMFQTGRSASELVKEKGLSQVSNAQEIETWVDEVFAAHAVLVDELKQGKSKVRAFLVGEIMKRSKGRANPRILNEIIGRKIKQ